MVIIYGFCTVKVLYQNLMSGNGFRFHSGNFNVKDESPSGRPFSEKADEIPEKVQQDRFISNVVIGMELGIDQKTVLKHLRSHFYKTCHNR